MQSITTTHIRFFTHTYSNFIGKTLPASAFGDATTAVITVIGGSYTQTNWYTAGYTWTWNNNYGSIAENSAYQKSLDADAVTKIKSADGLVLDDWGHHPAALYLKLNQ